MLVTNLTMLILFSILYMIGVLFIYFSKTRLKSEETKIYSLLIISNIIGLILQLLCDFVSFKYDQLSPTFCDLIFRFYLIYFVVWTTLIFIYLIEITFKNKEKLIKMAVIGAVIVGIGALILPYELYRNMIDRIYYTHHGAVSLVFIYAGIIGTLMFIILILKRKSISKRKSIPLWIFIISSLLLTYIQMKRPELVIMAAMESFICCMMYFTIENPDVQMISELYKNKKLIESSNEGTSRFLFKLTQDIKRPAFELKKISNEMLLTSDTDKLKECAEYINNYSNQLDYLINDALNLSSMNTQKIKVFDSKYNIYRLFKEINIHNETLVHSGVTFKGNIDESIPTYLYGDSIKLKQIINSVINNSIKNTNSGFINFDISSIIKYDICRLFISVEDSGKGMDIEKINDLMSLDDDSMNSIDVDKLQDKNNLDYKEIKKLVSVLGGAVLIKGEEEKGINVVITLDQKIVPSEDVKMAEKLETYEQLLHSGIKCLVIDEDETELKHITDLLKSEDYNVDSSVFEMDCIDKLNKKMKYDFIILDDEMPNYNAIDILKKLKENKDFKTPVIVMINDNKDGIKLQYLRDGFSDYILKSKLDSEIKRVTKRF